MFPKEGKPALLSQSELLAVLDPDPSQAEEKYLELFGKLLRYFEWNRKADPEDLAQETLRRGFSRLQQGQKITIDDPAGYFFGIARNLVREGWNVPKVEQLDVPDLSLPEPSYRNLNRGEQLIFLKECLQNLPLDEFNMLLAYVEGAGERWAQKAGLPPGTLRMRIHRIRRRLESLARAKET